MERERKRISIIEHNSLKIIFCLINCGQSTNNNLNDTLVTNENKQMYMAKKKKREHLLWQPQQSSNLALMSIAFLSADLAQAS